MRKNDSIGTQTSVEIHSSCIANLWNSEIGVESSSRADNNCGLYDASLQSAALRLEWIGDNELSCLRAFHIRCAANESVVVASATTVFVMPFLLYVFSFARDRSSLSEPS